MQQNDPVDAGDTDTQEPAEDVVRDANEEDVDEEAPAEIVRQNEPETGLAQQGPETGDDAPQEVQVASNRPADAEVADDGRLDEFRRKALDGDRDAALELARHYDGAGDPTRSASYALIVLEDGGNAYARHFLTDTKSWSKDFWTALQGHLKDEGMYRGAIDGLPGRGTKGAVQRYAGMKVAAQPVVVRQPQTVTTKRTAPPPEPAKPKAPPTAGQTAAPTSGA